LFPLHLHNKVNRIGGVMVSGRSWVRAPFWSNKKL